MNRIVIFKNELDNKVATINCELRSTHIQTILKRKVGDKIKLTIENQGLATGTILSILDKEMAFQVEEIKEGTPSNIDLVIGLSRPQTCKKVIEHATTLGAASFFFTPTKLGEKSYAKANLFKNKEYEKLTHLGISQSNCYYQVPQVSVLHSLKNVTVNGEQNFILSPFAKKTFSDYEINHTKKTTLAIGSERGWTEEEVQILKEKGFKEVFISNSILRVETATFAALSQLELLSLNNKKRRS